MNGVLHGVSAAVVVMFLAAMAMTLAIAAVGTGLKLARRWYAALEGVGRWCRRRARLNREYHALLNGMPERLDEDFFEPWADEERRRRERS